MKNRIEQNYISPEIEVMLIEIEQNIMGASTEEIGETLDEIPW